MPADSKTDLLLSEADPDSDWLFCWAQERRDRVALVGTWCPARVKPPQFCKGSLKHWSQNRAVQKKKTTKNTKKKPHKRLAHCSRMTLIIVLIPSSAGDFSLWGRKFYITLIKHLKEETHWKIAAKLWQRTKILVRATVESSSPVGCIVPGSAIFSHPGW